VRGLHSHALAGDVPHLEVGILPLRRIRGIRVRIHMTHFSDAAGPDSTVTDRQLACFEASHRQTSGAQTAADYERYRHASRYPRGAIHPLIERNTYSEFMKGDYDTAVFKAFKTLEDAVRTRGGFGNESIGVPLMREAFRKRDRSQT
jgi:hypothetical protein